LACFIADEICRLIKPDSGLYTGDKDNTPKAVKLSDIYILTRTGNEGRQIGEVLRSYGVPHAFYKQEGLFQTDEAHNLYKLLCAIDKPGEPGLRMSAWLTPFFGLPLAELQAWREAGESHPLVALLFEWRRLAESLAWSRFFDAIMTDSGLIRRLIFTGSERALTNYLHLSELLLADTHLRPITLADLTRGLKARIDGRKMPEGRDGDIQRLETDREAVQILTMHKAKGLEAEVIFIGGGFGNYSGGRGIKTSIYHSNNQRHLHIGRATGKIAQAIELENREEEERLFYVALTRAKSRLYLPYFGKGSDPVGEERTYGYNKLGSFYQAMQKRLDLLRERGSFEDKSLYALREASCARKPLKKTTTASETNTWPQEGLIEIPPLSAKEAMQIKPRSRGVLLTSYTRIKQGDSWKPLAAGEETREEMRSEEISAEYQTIDPAAIITGEAKETEMAEHEKLPGGKKTGIFLHALLEDTPAEEVRQFSYEKWVSLELVQNRAASCARGLNYNSEYLPLALQMIYNALSIPVEATSLENNCRLVIPGGIASGKHQRKEMSFIYPIPEHYHKLLADDQAEIVENPTFPFRVLRGYLQGLIDLVFEYEGKIYLLDWKSDQLAAYDRENLSRHVEKNYSLQAKVYSLAVIRLLGINNYLDYDARFGGVLYLFLRGFEAPDCRDNSERTNQGVWFSRPTFDQVAAWEKEFVERSEWGGEVIIREPLRQE